MYGILEADGIPIVSRNGLTNFGVRVEALSHAGNLVAVLHVNEVSLLDRDDLSGNAESNHIEGKNQMKHKVADLLIPAARSRRASSQALKPAVDSTYNIV
jgi:hypothetical protein